MNTYTHYHKFEAFDAEENRAVYWLEGNVVITDALLEAIHSELDDILARKNHASK